MRMRQYDLLVVGGGIHGCGVALAAAARGYRTLLVEKDVLASGASGRSSKLIQGDLHFLERGGIGRVREALKERRILLDIAPDIVQMHDFHMPLYRDGRYPAWRLAARLPLYRLLAPEGGWRRLSAEDALQRLPGLAEDGLQGALLYRDAVVDDAVLVRAVAAAARRQGATIMEHTTFSGAWHSRAGWHVWLAHGQEVKAKVIVNATGPWVNRVHRLMSPRPPMREIELLQAGRIVISRDCPGYLSGESADGRTISMLPWRQGETQIGMAEASQWDDPADSRVSQEEKVSLLSTWNRHFPARRVVEQDIRHEFSDVRVLPKATGDVSGRVHETVLLPDHAARPSLVTVYGGRLATYRRDAEKVMAMVAHSLPPSIKTDTTAIPLV